MIYTQDNFIDTKTIDHYLEIPDSIEWVEAHGDHKNWHNRVYPLLRTDYISSVPVLKKIQQTIQKETGKLVYADTFNLVRWRVGDYQMPHADAENPNGDPHPFPWRNYGCMLYLNNNFSGGEIYFPDHDIEIKPRPGLLAFFPGTTEYMHGVREVTEGTRYTIGSFWTTDYTKRVKKFYDWRLS